MADLAPLDLEALLAPLDGPAPCGADLEYEPDFLALQTAGSRRPEQQYGDTVIPAQEPDWTRVHELALGLARRSRDLRLAVWLLRSRARLAGYAAALDALLLVQGLLQRCWDGLHPQLDASDGNDATARLNALLPLVDGEAALADLRAAALSSQRGGPRLRDAELALGLAEALPGESVPALPGLLEVLIASDAAAVPALAQRLQAGLGAAQAMAARIEQQLGGAQGPDFAPLLRLLKATAALGARLLGTAAPQPEDVAAAGPARSVGGSSAGGAIASRDEALRALQRACDWIERNEPSNPAPLLIRRAQRLMSKNFMDIIRDLVPEGLREVEKLAGVGSE